MYDALSAKLAERAGFKAVLVYCYSNSFTINQLCAIIDFMWKPAKELSITDEQRATLKAWVAAKTSPQRTVLRARICLLAAEGLPNRLIARSLKTSRPTVVQWRKRFEERGPQGLAEDASHGLSSRALPPEKIKAIVEATLHTTPPDATHWSTRTMAQAMGVSNATVSRVWDAHGLQPHRVEGFKLSPPFPLPLHADLFLVAEPRRTVVRRNHPQAHPPRRVRQCGRSGVSH